MLNVFIKYNPYTVHTEVSINGAQVTSNSPLYNKMHQQRLQTWIEPHAGWGGLFEELYKHSREHEVLIRFHGTPFDYADLEYAKERYGNVIFQRVEMEHINRDTCKLENPKGKLEELRMLYEELQNGPIDEFKSDEIRERFENAMDSDFEIVVVAPMSSGKSTLINAILGQDLLPAINQATTATIAKIRASKDASSREFTVTAKLTNGAPLRFQANPDGTFAEDEQGNYICSSTGKPVEKVPATPKLIEQLNYLKDAADPNPDPKQKKALVDTIVIEGPAETIMAGDEGGFNTVLVDTPGGNNAANEEHREIMEKAIRSEDKSLILYVFNGTQTGTDDSNNILKMIAEEMKNSSDGKQSRDRFLFVANRMDDIDLAKESYESFQTTITDMLRENEIYEPNLFFVSSQLAKLIRLQRAGQRLTKQEKASLAAGATIFGDMSDGDDYCLYKYSSISDCLKADYDNALENLTDPYRIAEINSGVPALEAAIREYVEKYAVSIKVKNAHDTFMKKVKEREMVDACEAKWASSKDELEKVRAEIKEKQARYMKDKKLAEFRGRIDRIALDETPIFKVEADLRKKIDKIRNRYTNEIRKEQAETIVSMFKKETEVCLKGAWAALVEAFNNGIIKMCNKTVEEYQAYVKTLEDSGLFELGGIRVQELEKFRNLTLGSTRELLDDAHIETRKESVGTRPYERSGFFNKVKRLFGIKSGWGTENIYETVEYVKVPGLVQQTLKQAIEIDFNDEITDQKKEVEKEIELVKQAAYVALDRVDIQIKELFDDINSKISDESKLKKIVAANKEYLEWMQSFISKVDAILEI